jgi:hypothetical protein
MAGNTIVHLGVDGRRGCQIHHWLAAFGCQPLAERALARTRAAKDEYPAWLAQSPVLTG